MSLPDRDTTFLSDRNIEHSVSMESGMVCLVLTGWPIPIGYDSPSADLLLRLSPGYPDVPPDMWWFDPGLRLVDGRCVPATDQVENHLGRSWQRWSRHFAAGQWRPGVDCLESYLALIHDELARWASGAAA